MCPLGGTVVSPAGKIYTSPSGSRRYRNSSGTSTVWPHGVRNSFQPSFGKPKIVLRGKMLVTSMPMASCRSRSTRPSIW